MCTVVDICWAMCVDEVLMSVHIFISVCVCLCVCGGASMAQW